MNINRCHRTSCRCRAWVTFMHELGPFLLLSKDRKYIQNKRFYLMQRWKQDENWPYISMQWPVANKVNSWDKIVAPSHALNINVTLLKPTRQEKCFVLPSINHIKSTSSKPQNLIAVPWILPKSYNKLLYIIFRPNLTQKTPVFEVWLILPRS